MAPRVEVGSRDAGSAIEVTVTGSADVAAGTLLREQLLGAIVLGRAVVLRLDALERLDGAGVQILLAAHAFVTRAGASLTVTSASEPAMRAIETAGATALLAPQ